MKRTTSVAQAADGDRPRPTRREIELMLLACAAAGRAFELRPDTHRDDAGLLALRQITACDVIACLPPDMVAPLQGANP